jgi:hypothetical protein
MIIERLPEDKQGSWRLRGVPCSPRLLTVTEFQDHAKLIHKTSIELESPVKIICADRHVRYH